MADVGDRISVAGKGGGTRRGRIVDKTGTMLTVEWDHGERTTFMPGPGAVTVERRDVVDVVEGSAKKQGAAKGQAKKAAKSKKKG